MWACQGGQVAGGAEGAAHPLGLQGTSRGAAMQAHVAHVRWAAGDPEGRERGAVQGMSPSLASVCPVKWVSVTESLRGPRGWCLQFLPGEQAWNPGGGEGPCREPHGGERGWSPSAAAAASQDGEGPEISCGDPEKALGSGRQRTWVPPR